MALSDLVNDPYSAKRYLAEIGAYNIAGSATATVRVSGHGPAGTQLIVGRVLP